MLIAVVLQRDYEQLNVRSSKNQFESLSFELSLCSSSPISCFLSSSLSHPVSFYSALCSTLHCTTAQHNIHTASSSCSSSSIAEERKQFEHSRRAFSLIIELYLKRERAAPTRRLTLPRFVSTLCTMLRCVELFLEIRVRSQLEFLSASSIASRKRRGHECIQNTKLEFRKSKTYTRLSPMMIFMKIFS